jgi:hypothetical protein
LLVLTSDEGLQNVGLNAPLTPSADLDTRQFATAHKCIYLGAGDVQLLRDIGKGEETHGRIVPKTEHLRDQPQTACG